MDRTLPWILAGVGVFALVAAAQDWDWFMNSRKAALWVRLFGRNGARLFYGVLGLVILGIAAGLLTGALPG